jgi:hypothetical protein
MGTTWTPTSVERAKATARSQDLYAFGWLTKRLAPSPPSSSVEISVKTRGSSWNPCNVIFLLVFSI